LAWKGLEAVVFHEFKICLYEPDITTYI